MTVGDLIAYLEQFDEDTEVYLNNDNGYTYGSIDEMSFEEQEDDGEPFAEKMQRLTAELSGLFSESHRLI